MVRGGRGPSSLGRHSNSEHVAKRLPPLGKYRDRRGLVPVPQQLGTRTFAMQKNVFAPVKGDEMDATVEQAAEWAEALLQRSYRGPGDTIEAAMYRAETRFGIAAQTFWTLRYRRPRDILASVYLRLQAAYEAEVAVGAARLKHEAELTKQVGGNDAATADLLAQAEALVREVESEEGGGK